jgi:hypothetical protein
MKSLCAQENPYSTSISVTAVTSFNKQYDERLVYGIGRKLAQASCQHQPVNRTARPWFTGSISAYFCYVNHHDDGSSFNTSPKCPVLVQNSKVALQTFPAVDPAGDLTWTGNVGLPKSIVRRSKHGMDTMHLEVSMQQFCWHTLF